MGIMTDFAGKRSQKYSSVVCAPFGEIHLVLRSWPDEKAKPCLGSICACQRTIFSGSQIDKNVAPFREKKNSLERGFELVTLANRL